VEVSFDQVPIPTGAPDNEPEGRVDARRSLPSGEEERDAFVAVQATNV
jgi:hypothetical protein